MAKQQGKKVECPPWTAELGWSSWTILHSSAAWYPDTPTTEQRTKITNSFHSLAEFYPCPWCADDFQDNIEKTPVQADTREDLCMWLCDQHQQDSLNQKLGETIISMQYEKS